MSLLLRAYIGIVGNLHIVSKICQSKGNKHARALTYLVPSLILWNPGALNGSQYYYISSSSHFLLMKDEIGFSPPFSEEEENFDEERGLPCCAHMKEFHIYLIPVSLSAIFQQVNGIQCFS